MTTRRDEVLRLFGAKPLLIEAAKLDAAYATRRPYATERGVAIIDIAGVLANEPSLFDAFVYGATAYGQILDEVEQARVRPLHVLEDEDGRVRAREPLEEQPLAREQVVALVRGGLLRDPEQAIELAPGDTFTVAVRRPHRVTNAGEGCAIFFVLQDGTYDFVPVA